MIMLLNDFIIKARQISWQLSSGDIPLTLNGSSIDLVDITLEGDNGNYFVDLKVIYL